ncbi:small secreted protein, partial [Podospora australis]
LTTLALLVVSASATLKKANEYKSGDCSGDLNFGHKSGNLGDVTMDDSTHSVYLATQEGDDTWEGWSGKTKNGGGCTGEKLGLVPHLECLNLDTTTTQRIQCVRYV